MSESEGASPAAGSTADAIRADIEQTRTELAGTVDALTDKFDVKARAGDKVAEAKAEVKAKAADAAEQIRPYRIQILAAAVAGVVVLVVIRKWRG